MSDDRPGEAVPGHVGLRAGQHEDVAPRRRTPGAQLDRRPDEVGVDAVAKLHDRAPGAVVDERVVVEPHERAGLALLRQCGGRRCRSAGGVDPSGEHHDEDGLVEHRLVDEPLVRAVAVAAPVGSRQCVQVALGGGGGLFDLQLERRELLGWSIAERAAEVARVHALDDAGQLPEGERDVEVELRDVAPGDLGVALGELRGGPRTRAPRSTCRSMRPRRRSGRSSTPAAGPTSASGSPSVQISQSSTATTSPSSPTMQLSRR